jgi:hypothetical protein
MVTTAAEVSHAAPLFESECRSTGEPVTSAGLTRSQVIERIMAMNATASVEFLDGFSERALQTYLDHLASAQVPRGRTARWVRPGDTPAIVMAEPKD